jgi:cyclic beta-1,2-glucan synthetase
LLNPINHARTPEATDRYKVEPYVVAADVYSVAPHTGRGGWTWYTGSAAWMYRAGIEGILGIRREGDYITIAPCIPSTWPGFEATIKLDSSRFDISVVNESGDSVRAMLDGRPIDSSGQKLRLHLDGEAHHLSIQVGSG